MGTNRVYDVIIIGAGFCGLISAIKIKDQNSSLKIALIERNSRVGKKILSTGNGQCNLTNSDMNLSHFHGGDLELVKSVISRYNRENLIKFFNENGVLTVEDNSKIYPASKQAQSVLDALRFKVDSLGLDLFTEELVLRVDCERTGRNREKFIVKTQSGNNYYSSSVLLCTGGKSSKHLGSDGSGYILAEKLGHSVTELAPSLVQLKTECVDTKGLKGIKSAVKLFGNFNGKEVETEGDLLFTEYGISGNAVFYLSAYAKVGDVIYSDFAPFISKDELIEFLENKKSCSAYLVKEDFLSGVINKQLGKVILKRIGVKDFDGKIEDLNVKRLVELIKKFPFKVVGNCGFDNAQVTKGGINLKDVNIENLESKKVKGLFFGGEILDVDGDCGGYNLQWAYSSASVVADGIVKYANGK